MSDNQLIKLYKQLDSILDIYNGWLWQDILRYIGSGLVNLLIMLNGLLENIVDKVITFNNFYSSKGVQDFMDTSRPIVWGLFLLALTVLGFQIMLNKVEKRNDLVLNVILAACMIIIIPDLMVNMGKITNAGVKAISPNSTKISEEIVKSNVADILYYAQKDFTLSSEKNGTKNTPPRPVSTLNSSIGTTDFTNANQISTGAINYINFAEKLDLQEDDGWIFKEDWVKNLNDDSKDVLKKKLAATGVGDNYVIRELDGNSIPGTTLGQESYYRYHVNWGILIFSLLVTTIALGITILKIGRAAFDLAFHQIFGTYVAITDLSGGQRTKKVLVEIASTFSIIYIMVLLLKLFIMYANWAGGLKGEIGGLGVLILLIAGAWALIDAPDIVQRLLGIDAGIRGGANALMAQYAAAKMPYEGLKATKRGIETLSNVAKMPHNAYKSARDKISGISDSLSNLTSKGKGIAKEPVKPIPAMDSGNSSEKENSAALPNSNSNAFEEIPINDNTERQDGILSTETNMNNKGNEEMLDKDKLEKQVPKMPSSTPDLDINSSTKDKNKPSTPTLNNEVKEIPSAMDGMDTSNGEVKEMPSAIDSMDTSNGEVKEMPSAIDGMDTSNGEVKEIPSTIDSMDTSNGQAKEIPTTQDMSGSASSLSKNIESSQMKNNQLTENTQPKKIIPPINNGYSLGNGIREVRTNIQQSNDSSLRQPKIENKGGIDE